MFFSDVLDLSKKLIAYSSITPDQAGCLTDLHTFLSDLGWTSQIKTFNHTTNLYAYRGQGHPHLCFAGHIDVVPPGDLQQWTYPPFEPTINQGMLYGRGVADMKGAVACFLCAILSFRDFKGTCSLLLTSDEEGPAFDGIQRMMPWLGEQSFSPDLILIGEPTGQTLGEVIQIGRRGSLTGQLTVRGTQGHIAYPHLADNPLLRAITCAQALGTMTLDKEKLEAFQPSHLELTSIDTGNMTTNLIPSSCQIRFGVRYNPLQTSMGLCEKIRDLCADIGGQHELVFQCHGDAFLTEDEAAMDLLEKAVMTVMGRTPQRATQGGTTDGRFLSKLAPVLELGLPETTIHQVNERVAIQDLHELEAIYTQVLKNFFAQD